MHAISGYQTHAIFHLEVTSSLLSGVDMAAGSEPMRGHHVINNGVRRALPSIINNFLTRRGTTFKDLGLNETHAVWEAHEKPLSREDLQQMDEMTVRTPQGDTHTDQNDREYGEVIEQLRTAVVTCMDSLFEEFDSG